MQWFIFKRKTKSALANYLRNKIATEKLEKDIAEETLVMPALDDVQAVFEQTEKLYRDTEFEISKEKAKQSLPSRVRKAIKKDSESESLHLETLAKDKLYVKTLKEVAKLLDNLRKNASALELGENLNLDPSDESYDLDEVKLQRKKLIKTRAKLIVEFEKEQGKALIYANEAYFSGGSAYHVVKGMQGGKGVDVNRQQKMQSLLMNIGYKLQHFQHKAHDSLGRAMIDTSKYGQRVADLALIQNLKIQDTELELFEILSVEAKEMLIDDIDIVTRYKKGTISPTSDQSIETPSSKESAAEEDFIMTIKNVETNFLEIAHKTLAPYYWDKYKTKGRLWSASAKRTGYHHK